jgi:redox-sensitive bicupin YhaK (pirin superfamily)
MNKVRRIRAIFRSAPVLEGAGVRLKRAFGFRETPNLDPFLLLDDFHSADPADYLAGFPWHPHRGIETITYVLHGRIEHSDSMGNRGVIGPGESSGLLWGFQLWANLPASHKMMDPRYRDVPRETIPLVELDGGAQVRVICGEVAGTQGPVRDIVTDPQYLDVTLPAGAQLNHGLAQGFTAIAYVIEGQGQFGAGPDVAGDAALGAETLVVYEDGDAVAITAGEAGLRFLLFAGWPIREPVAWRGPIVMNTDEELRVAFNEYRKGTFLKSH